MVEVKNGIADLPTGASLGEVIANFGRGSSVVDKMKDGAGFGETIRSANDLRNSWLRFTAGTHGPTGLAPRGTDETVTPANIRGLQPAGLPPPAFAASSESSTTQNMSINMPVTISVASLDRDGVRNVAERLASELLDLARA